MKAKQPPMSREAWLADGELHGHTIEQTIGYLADCADFADWQESRQRFLPPGFVSPDCEPRLVTRLRRLFGR